MSDKISEEQATAYTLEKVPYPIQPLPLPPDWWKCLRFGPVSGRYYGEMSAPIPGSYALDLRIDIDPRHANSPVMNRVSGDIYKIHSINWWGKKYSWRVYKESWIVNKPTVKWSKCSVGITGEVSFFKGIHPITNIEIAIPWKGWIIGPAEVKVISPYSGSIAFTCEKKSNAFRDVTIEVDVCNSVNTPPILPSYDTHSHSTRPVDLPRRTLTIEEAYMEAGIDADINPTHTIIDDSASQFNVWSDAELHDAMEQHFSQYQGTWPKWHLWCLLAGGTSAWGTGVAGIMFDYGTQYLGPGLPPERQGCAIFRNHSIFNNLVSNPVNNAQAAALRDFLYCYVHELGHAFNFLHSWNKGRPNALSWMNYPQYVTNYWNNFRFRFDDEELIHLRHGDRISVIPGGDPWATGSHLEAPTSATADLMGETPVDLLLRSKEYFQFMEPVIIELRIRNTTDQPLEINPQLNPEFGRVIIYIRSPYGRILEYAPVQCKLATPEIKVLKPRDEGVEGEDRHSQNVVLSYGAFGHYFKDPGEYLIRAVYHGSGNELIPSNVHRVIIGHPLTRDDERLAKDFFTYEAGMALYLNGSSSPFLKKGMGTLETMTEVYQESPVGAHISLALAQNLARPFRRIEQSKLVEYRTAEPKQALNLINKSMLQQERDETTFQNITYHYSSRLKANLLASLGEKAKAKKELTGLVKYLEARNVNRSVLDEIEAYAKEM